MRPFSPSRRSPRLLLPLALFILAPRADAQSGAVGFEAPPAPRAMAPGSAFEPYWSGDLCLSRCAQPASDGGGQTGSDLTFTATDNLDEAGDFLSLGAGAGSLKVEGNQSAYGTLDLGGGLSAGAFLPALSLQGQYGQAGVRNYSALLNLDFQVSDPLLLGVLLGGGFQGHQQALSQTTGTVNTKNWTAGAELFWQAFPDLGFNAAVQQQTDITYSYDVVVLGKRLTRSVDQSDRIPSATLGAAWEFVKGWTLAGTAQYGREYYPAGTFYSPVLGKSVTFSKAASQDFAGYGLSLTWDFDFGGSRKS